MCGLIFTSGDAPSDLVAAAVRWAGQRGPHEHGTAAFDGNAWQVQRGRGPLSAVPDGTVVGHSRLATMGASPGDAPSIAEAQPYTTGRFMVAHNGTIPVEVTARYAHVTVDSEALLVELERGGTPVDVLADTPAPAALLWADGSQVFAYRHPGRRLAAHPLFLADGNGWRVLSSGPILGSRLLPEGEPVALTA